MSKRDLAGKDPATDFGRTLIALMRAKELSQADFARKTREVDRKFDEYAVSKYVSDVRERNPGPERVAVVARVFPDWSERVWAAWRRDRVREILLDEKKAATVDPAPYYRSILDPKATADVPASPAVAEARKALAAAIAHLKTDENIAILAAVLADVPSVEWDWLRPVLVRAVPAALRNKKDSELDLKPTLSTMPPRAVS